MNSPRKMRGSWSQTVWDSAKAYRETTPTRERLSINGLWRWQPAGSHADAVPTDEWGDFKVPGCWPGIELEHSLEYVDCESDREYDNRGNLGENSQPSGETPCSED